MEENGSGRQCFVQFHSRSVSGTVLDGQHGVRLRDGRDDVPGSLAGVYGQDCFDVADLAVPLLRGACSATVKVDFGLSSP